MEHASVEKLARALRVLVWIVFVCNLLALLLVPGIALLQSGGGLKELVPYENPFEVPLRLGIGFVLCWAFLWVETYSVVMAIFLWLCGICTAIILWQAKRVLDNIIAGSLFSQSNALHLRRAAVCSFIISAASLLWALCRAVMNGMLELFSLSTLFFPVFFLAALLFLVMFALFRQAAEMKAENDLTI